MWTVSVTAGQSELNEARVTNEQTQERTNTPRDLLKLIYRWHMTKTILESPAAKVENGNHRLYFVITETDLKQNYRQNELCSSESNRHST